MAYPVNNGLTVRRTLSPTIPRRTTMNDGIIRSVCLSTFGYGDWFRLTPSGAKWQLLIADPRPYSKGKDVRVEVCIGSEDKQVRWVDETSKVYPCEDPVAAILPIDSVGRRVG
jgi:hypothetical protein